MTSGAASGPAPALGRATQAALALSLILFVFGSSSVAELHRIGSPLRWLGLLAFAVAAAAWAAAERGGLSRLLPVAWPTAVMAALAVASAGWSIDPRLTIERAATFVIALAAAAAVGTAVRGVRAAELVAEAIVGAATVVCLAGGALYAVDPADAVQLPQPLTPLRFGGIGENPNTVQMLAALAVVPAIWLVVRPTGRRRTLAGIAVVVLSAHIAASGSRGGVLALAIGGACFALAAPSLRHRLGILVGVVALAGAVLAGNQVMLRTIPPAPSVTAPPAPPPSAPGTGSAKPGAPGTGSAKPGAYPVTVLQPFDNERGGDGGKRSLFGGAGRGAALAEAFHQGNARPIAGFGFGTEEHAFFDRIEAFQSARPENSYLGLYLQLGVLGPLLWIAAGLGVAWLGLARARSLSPDVRLAAGAFTGAVAGGYALGLGQSYVYSVGNVATVAFWVSALVVAGLAGRTRVQPVRRGMAVAVVGVLATLVALVPLGRWEGSRDEARQNAGMARIWKTVGGLGGRKADGFRLSAPESCVLYASGREPAAYELCFQDGRLVEAYDRLHGAFHVFSLRPFGPGPAAISVSAAAVDARIRSLDAHPDAEPLGPAYLTRPIPR